MKTEVTLDIREKEGYMVWVDGKPTTPTFNSRGAAEAYAYGIERGDRTPEFSAAMQDKLDAAHLMMLRYVHMAQRVNLLECTRAERLVMWSLAEMGLVASTSAFYTITPAGRDRILAASKSTIYPTLGGPAR